MNVDFYYSIGSRYSYLASTQIESLEEETGCSVVWHPVNSVRLLERRGVSPFTGEPVSVQYEWAYRELDAKRWAALYEVPYVEPRGRIDFDSELLALACTAAKRLGKEEEFSRRLFELMFQGSHVKIDENECTDSAEACGISREEFCKMLSSQETLRQLDATLEQAINSGVFGVPSFIASGELFFGNDRIVLLEHYLYSNLA